VPVTPAALFQLMLGAVIEYTLPGSVVPSAVVRVFMNTGITP
jgi:hypothetical protein